MRKLLAALLLCFAAAAPVNAATVTIAQLYVETTVVSEPTADQDFDVSTAYGTRAVTSAVGISTSTIDLDWHSTGSGALLNFDYSHVRTGANNDYTLAYTYVNFTVDENADYSLSGLYSATGPENLTYSEVYLYDFGSSTMIFRDLNYSFYTSNESFILGAVGDGDTMNDTSGSLTGTLFAGSEYQLFFASYIQASLQADDGATATGCLTFSVGGATSAGDCSAAPAPVPLPAAAWLLLSGLAGLGIVGRRKAG